MDVDLKDHGYLDEVKCDQQLSLSSSVDGDILTASPPTHMALFKWAYLKIALQVCAANQPPLFFGFKYLKLQGRKIQKNCI